ncbi:MAG: glycosyltransferase family 2 protein [Deltaproteobacteria bacterium]|nr:glycosyltransferase family 2 protein [Deltaproteobacteria bacterium]
MFPHAGLLFPLAMSSFTVIVPALNEEENLRPAVEAILKEIGPRARFLEVLVFDDASTDRTGEIADELSRQDARVCVFHNPQRLNIGGIYKAGIKEARGDYVLWVPGDNETRLDEIAKGLEYLDGADIVVFYVTNDEVRAWPRRVLSRLYVRIVNLLFGTRFRYTNSMNIFRTNVVRRVPIVTNGFAYQTEALVKAVRSGVDFVQVGIKIKARDSGTSKALTWKNFVAVAVALGRLWWDLKVKERHRYRRSGRLLGVF